MSNPEYGERSPDGNYWWDGSNWQLVDASQGEGGQTAGQTSDSQAGDTSGGESGDNPLLAKVDDPSELQGHFDNAMEAAEGEATELEA